MSGFASKWMLYAAALQAGWAVPAMVAWAVSLGTVFLGAKATSAVFLGPLTEATKDAHESPPTMLWGMGFLAAGSVVLGVAPQLAVNYLLNPVLAHVKLDAVQVTWFGLSGNAGSFSSMGGLVLALGLARSGRRHLRRCLRRASGDCAVQDGAALAGWRGSLPVENPCPNRAGSRPATSPASSCRTGMDSSAGPMWIAFIWPSGADCRLFRAAWASWSPGWSSRRGPGCRAGRAHTGCRSLADSGATWRHLRAAVLSNVPQLLVAACAVAATRIDSGRARARQDTATPRSVDDSGRRSHRRGSGRRRSLASSCAFSNSARFAHHSAGLANRADAIRQAGLPGWWSSSRL